MRKLVLGVIMGLVLLMGVSVQAKTGDRLTVLMYHHLLEEKDMPENPCIISMELFSEHMWYLKQNGYETVTLEELEKFLYEGGSLPDKSVMITFDDGYLSNYIYAYPILKEYGYTAVIFPVGLHIEEETQVLDVKDLDRLSFEDIEKSKDLFEFGSHTYEMHGMEDRVADLVRLEDVAVKEDMEKSKEMIEDITSFAYPFGIYDEETIEMLKETGYKLAFTTKAGKVTKNTNPYTINRYPIYQDTTLDRFKKMFK